MAIIGHVPHGIQQQHDERMIELARQLQHAYGEVFTDEHPILKKRIKVRAGNGQDDEIDLRVEINKIRAGEYFPRTKWKKKPIEEGCLTDIQLWDHLSSIMTEVIHIYNDVARHETIPLKWLIVRDKRDFIAGSWNLYSRHWQHFIHYMPEDQQSEVYSSIFHGVDITQETQHYTAMNPTFFRSKRSPMVSIPIFDVNYHYAYDHTHTDYDRKVETLIRKGRKIKRFKKAPDWALKPFAYRPMLMEQYRQEDRDRPGPGFFPTSKKHLLCQETINQQGEKWLMTGALRLVGRYDELIKSKKLQEQCNTIMSISVEQTKPRVCCDGGCHKAICPNKIPCRLDTIEEVLKVVKPGALFIKTDDANGFQHVLLNQWSAPLCGIRIGDLVYTANALPFGLTQE